MASIQRSQIDYILTLAKTGSFSKSAKACFVTQSTLSIMIKKYEEEIGFQLFDRKTKPISLTPEGRLIIEQLRLIRFEYDNLEEVVKETRGEHNGDFRVGIIPTLAPFLLPRFLNKIIHTYPNIKFTIHEITTEEIVGKIKGRDLDVGIVSIPLIDPQLVEISLFIEDFVVYDTRKGKEGRIYSVGDIDIDRLWLLEEGHCMRNQIGKICNLRKNRAVKNNIVYNSGSILSLIELVKISEGITLLPRLAIDNNALLDKQCIYSLVEPVPTREIGLISHSNFPKKRFLKIMESVIKESVKGLIKEPSAFKTINPF